MTDGRYESNLIDCMHDYSLNPSAYLLCEVEVFSGSILGKSLGAVNKRVRENNAAMKERVNRDVEFTVERITHGDSGDKDEALARSIACLAVGMEEEGRKFARVGQLQSWKYVAAAVVLQELHKFQGGIGPLRRI